MRGFGVEGAVGTADSGEGSVGWLPSAQQARSEVQGSKHASKGPQSVPASEMPTQCGCAVVQWHGLLC